MISVSPETLKNLVKIQNLPAEIEKASERALDESAAAILNRLRTGYLQETDPFGKPWIPSLAGAKRRARGRGFTLFDTGRLFHSIQLYRTAPGERLIGTDVPYAGWLNFGTSKMVARPFLAVTEEHVQLSLAIYTFRLSEALYD